MTSTVTISPLSNAASQASVPDSGSSDYVAPQVAVDSVFADDNLSVGLADTLIS
jgi:hypothetical protein